jgi:predicted esterase
VLDDRIWMYPGRQRLYMAGLEGLSWSVRPYIWSGEVRVLGRRKAGLGVLCEVQRIDAEKEWYDPRCFVFYSSQTPVMRADRSQGPPAPPQHGMDGTPMDGIMYRLRDEARGVRPQGVIFALRPLSGGTFIRSTLAEFRKRGWVVVETGSSFGLAGIGDTRDAQDENDLRRYAEQIGRLTDERLSEWAYGCEAMLEMVRQDRPELTDKPVVVVGFSAGAIGAPTVAARLGDQVKAIVLAGGGVNILKIAQTSALSDFGLGVKYRGHAVNGHELDVLSDAYLKASRLDGAHTAALLKHTPALVLHAAKDDIVPAPSGDELYELLGRPERWVYNMGHEMLFLTLGAYDAKIARWVQTTAGGQVLAKGKSARQPTQAVTGP